MTSGWAVTASSIDDAVAAPRARSGVARSGLRFHTVVSWPASSRVLASALPMAPSPSTVTPVPTGWVIKDLLVVRT